MNQTELADGLRNNDQRTKPLLRSIVTFALSAIAAVISATELHGWHVYLGFALVGVGLCFGFLSFKRKYASARPQPQ
jgi:uncharacterized membrane protein YccC